MKTINLHGLTLDQARRDLEEKMNNAVLFGERVVCIIHGQGKHSETFPVIKSYVRKWLESSGFAAEHVESVFRGEDGSPYTKPNAGETIVVLKGCEGLGHEDTFDWREEEEDEARKNAKGIRADRLRKLRRRGPKR